MKAVTGDVRARLAVAVFCGAGGSFLAAALAGLGGAVTILVRAVRCGRLVCGLMSSACKNNQMEK